MNKHAKWILNRRFTNNIRRVTDFYSVAIRKEEIPSCTKHELRIIIHHLQNLPPWHSHVINPTPTTISNLEYEPKVVTIDFQLTCRNFEFDLGRNNSICRTYDYLYFTSPQTYGNTLGQTSNDVSMPTTTPQEFKHNQCEGDSKDYLMDIAKPLEFQCTKNVMCVRLFWVRWTNPCVELIENYFECGKCGRVDILLLV